MSYQDTEQKDIQKFVPKHKMGIKVLGDTQLYSIFPTYQNLLGKIEAHRQEISKLSDIKTMMKERYQYNLMYDNVFSILGKRGTGKTSAVFSLKNIIENNKKEHPNDKVLPIIMPEVIPENGNILGWIIALLGDYVDEIEEDIKKNKKNSVENEFFRNCHFVENNPLRKSLKEMKELCFSQKYNPSMEVSFYEAIGNAAQQAQNNYSMAKAITNFWSELVNAIIESTGEKIDDNANYVPLIYFIFDDVDLSPDKVENLMSIITKYLSHPNVIVIVTADEELFLEVIENSIDKRIGRVNKDMKQLVERFMDNYLYYNSYTENLHLINKSNQISDTARFYLGKVLPPSSRYYLNLYHDYDKKKNFQIYQNKSIEIELCSKINRLIGKEDGSKENFLYYNNHYFVGFYMEYMGITARQLTNAFFIIEELIKNLERLHNDFKEDKNLNQYQYKIYNQIRHFVCSSITANNSMADNISDINDLVDNLLLLEYGNYYIFINYSYLNYRFHEFNIHKDNEEEIKGMISQTFALYSLLFFTENILVLIDQSEPLISPRKKMHGVSEFTEFINTSIFSGEPYIRIFDDSRYFLYHYEHFLQDALSLYQRNMNNPEYAIKYLHYFSDKESNDITARDIIQLYINNERWFLKIVGMLFLAYSKIYLLDIKSIRKYEISTDVLCSYDIYVNNQLKWLIQDYFKNVDLQNEDTHNNKSKMEDSGGNIEKPSESRIKETIYHMIVSYFEGSGADDISLTEISSMLHPVISQVFKPDAMVQAFLGFEKYNKDTDTVGTEEKLDQIIIDIKSEILEIKAATEILIHNTVQFVDNMNLLMKLKNGAYKTRIELFNKELKNVEGGVVIKGSGLIELLSEINKFIIMSKKRADNGIGEFSDDYAIAFQKIVNAIDYTVRKPTEPLDIENIIKLIMDVVFLRDIPLFYYDSQIKSGYKNDQSYLTLNHLITTLDGKNHHYYYKLYERIKWLLNRTKKYQSDKENVVFRSIAYLREEAIAIIQDAREEYLNDNWKG